MSKKMNLLEKVKLWYFMNKNIIQISLIFVVILSAGIFFSNFRQTQNQQTLDISMYTESTEVTSVYYEKIFGYPPMDSTIPPLRGIKVKYTYKVQNQKFEGKRTFYLKGFRKIMNAINKTPESLEIRYKSNNPEESVITIKENKPKLPVK